MTIPHNAILWPITDESAALLGYPTAKALRKQIERGKVPEWWIERQGRKVMLRIAAIRTAQKEIAKDGQKAAKRSHVHRKTSDVSNQIQKQAHKAGRDVSGAPARKHNQGTSRNVSEQAEGGGSARRTSLARREEARARARERLHGG